MRAVLLFVLVALSCGAEPLRVMSFNVRYPEPKDGANRWELRRDMLAAAIRAHDPDVFGTQELFHEQGEFLRTALPAYRWFGVSRRGNQQDEYMGVFYKPSRLKVVTSGNFWLSQTPDTPGSMSWNVSLPRMVTWALFEMVGTKRRFYFYNTHFPHRREDDAARLECARVIAARAAKLPGNVPFVMTGDFNAPAGGDVYDVFASKWTDAWKAAAHRFGPEGTSSGFEGRMNGRRIDWIFYRGPIKTLQAHTVTLNEENRFPSDHFPVFAVLEFEGGRR